MKKRFSTLTVVIIGFLMMATGVYANEAYREWAGTDDFRQTEKNLANIQTGINDLKDELEVAKSDSSTKQDTIDELDGKIETLESEKELIKNELEAGIREANNKKGPRHKYDAVKEVMDEWANRLGLSATDRLYDHGTSEEYDEKVEELEGKVKELEAKEQELEAKQAELNTKESELTDSNSDLEQAVKDMKKLEEQSGKVLESLNTDTEKEPTEEEL